MLEALPEFTALQRLSLQDFWCASSSSVPTFQICIHNDPHDFTLHHVRALHWVRKLSCWECRVFTEEPWQDDQSLNILSRLTGLTSLNLRCTHFTTGLEQLAALTFLRHLDLSLNPSFNGSGEAM